VAADRFGTAFATALAGAQVIADLIRRCAVVMLGEPKGVADSLPPRPLRARTEVARRLGEKIGAFVLAAVPLVAGFVTAIAEIWWSSVGMAWVIQS
jgi:hypothetical protein